jgi:hypothetical protein
MKREQGDIMWCLKLDGVGLVAQIAWSRAELILQSVQRGGNWSDMQESGYSTVRVRVTELPKKD